MDGGRGVPTDWVGGEEGGFKIVQEVGGTLGYP